jgi:hypothetical protein
VNPISLVDYTEDYSEGNTEHTGETKTATLQDMSMGRTLRARERLGPKVDLMGAFINTDNNDHTWFPKDKAHAITQRSVRSRQNNEAPDLRAHLSHRHAETTVAGPRQIVELPLTTAAAALPLVPVVNPIAFPFQLPALPASADPMIRTADVRQYMMDFLQSMHGQAGYNQTVEQLAVEEMITSPFVPAIACAPKPPSFTEPIFKLFDGRSDPVAHVGDYV